MLTIRDKRKIIPKRHPITLNYLNIFHLKYKFVNSQTITNDSFEWFSRRQKEPTPQSQIISTKTFVHKPIYELTKISTKRSLYTYI